MTFLKNIFLAVLSIGAIGFAGYSFYNYSLAPCDRPLRYAIGRFDSKFGVAEADFRAQILLAEKVWESELGRDVFSYDPEAEFKVNLIYDERQLATVQKQKTESGLSAAEALLNDLDARFGAAKKAHESETAFYKQAVLDFEAAEASYESKVAYWNKQGGAPKAEYEALQREGQNLKDQARALNNMGADLNQSTRAINSLLDERNRAAGAYNKVAENYNQKYGHGLEFNQAEYTGREINVYQFSDKKELQGALAHELGHALGMDHVENRSSIMYYVARGNTEAGLKPSEEDLEELNRVCS